MKKLIISFLQKRGYELIKRPQTKGSSGFSIEGLYYDLNIPNANYSPWNGDEKFLEIFKKIKNNTLVDIYRCYELWQLVEQTQKINNNAGVLEIGVWRGGTAAIMGQKLSDLESNSNLYLADTFEGVVKTSDKDKYYTGGEHKDTSQQIVEDLLSNTVKYKNYKILKGIFPDDTQDKINSAEVFGLCHIDVDVYDSAKDIITWVWNKLIIGGIIVFDDYGFHTCTGITKLVNEQRDLKDRIILHNLNGHAIMVKIG
jgi:O-methyltransferase